MDEADQEMKIVSDPFLDAGIDIPEELPYVQQTIHKRQKSLRKKLSFMTKALARSRDDLNSDNVSIAESLASEISQNSTIIEMKQKPSRINESGDKVYCESMNAMRTNESKPSINTASHKKGTTLKVANSEFQFFCYFVMGPYE